MRADPVTPETAAAVFLRDGSCIAPLLGGSAHDCWGRATLEHVKDELRMGKRAPSDLRHLVALCSGHTEEGRRAGYQWNTDKANRAKVRAYLERLGDPHAAHVDPCGPTCRNGGSR
jgi:hypothetical protein